MTTERDADRGLALRAARHAALADVSRLRIVDALRLGDASPAELRATLGLASNLLAHHLGALERVGLVRRRRSEADRRRSYVSLGAGAAAHLDPVDAPWPGTERLVFVCTGNSARSPLAAALWNRRCPEGPVATSAGTHPAERVAPRAEAAARRRGLELAQRPTLLGDAGSSLLVTVCDRAHEELARTAPAERPALHWSVPDPVVVGTAAAFEAAADELDARIRAVTDAGAP